jgi:hypothetical protein
MSFFKDLVKGTFLESEEDKKQRLFEEKVSADIKKRFLADSIKRYCAINKIDIDLSNNDEIDKLLNTHRESHNYWRYVWRRCNIIRYVRNGYFWDEQENQIQIEQDGLNDLPNDKYLFELQSLAKNNYRFYAPRTGYEGEFVPSLRLTDKQIIKLAKIELIATNILGETLSPSKKYGHGFVYIGKCTAGKCYVGQTTKEPESRWLQHRQSLTGPYKKGTEHVKWEVIKTCHASELDYFESYFIGVYDSFNNGYNDNQGNHLDAYLEGSSKK